jgi:hypothetical protein
VSPSREIHGDCQSDYANDKGYLNGCEEIVHLVPDLFVQGRCWTLWGYDCDCCVPNEHARGNSAAHASGGKYPNSQECCQHSFELFQLNKFSEQIYRILALQVIIALTLAITLVFMGLGGWAWWPVFLLLYAVSLSLAVLFLSRRPRSFWPSGYGFRGRYNLWVISFVSMLFPLGIFKLVYVKTPLVLGNVEYVLSLPYGVTVPVFSVLLPLFALQAFCSSVTYLVSMKLIGGARMRVETDPVSFVFLGALAVSFTELVGTLNLAIVLTGVWISHGNLNLTLSWIFALQFFMPTSMVVVTLGKQAKRKHRNLRRFVLVIAALFSLALPEVLPSAPSVITIVWAPTDWRSPLLASSTLSTLWGMALARAYALPPET